MSREDKFRLCPKAVRAIKCSPVKFAQIYRAAEKSQNVWRRAAGQAVDPEGDSGVVLGTYLSFCEAVTQLMNWDKPPEELCHPADRDRLELAMRHSSGEYDALSGDGSTPNAPQESCPLTVEANDNVGEPVASPDIADLDKSAETRPLAVNYPRSSILVTAAVSSLLFTVAFLYFRNADDKNPAARAEETIVPAIVSGDSSPSSDDANQDSKSNADVLSHVIRVPSALSVEAIGVSYRDRLIQASDALLTRFSGDSLANADVDMALGTALYGYLERSRAVEHFEKVVSSRQSELGPDHTRTIDAEFALADAYVNTGRQADGELLAHNVLEKRRRLLGGNARATLDSMFQLGRACAARQQHADAIALFKDVIDRTIKQDPDSEFVDDVLALLALSYCHTDQADQSAFLLKESLMRLRTSLGDNHSTTLRTQQQLGETYLHVGEPELAEFTIRQVCDALVDTLGPTHSQSIGAKLSLAMANSKLRRFDVAESLYLEAIAGEQLLYGTSPDRHVMSLCFYARVLRDTGRYSDAEAIMRYVVNSQSSRFGDGHIETVSSLRTLASIYRAQRRYPREVPWQVRTVIARHRVHGHFAKGTKKAWRELLNALLSTVGQFSVQGLSGAGRILIDEVQKHRSLPTGIPIVENIDSTLR